MRTALGYVRVSTDEQADRGLGLEAQRQRIQGYCQMKGMELGTVFEDPGVSGGMVEADSVDDLVRFLTDADSIGIAWQGNRHHKLDRSRSVALGQFAPLAVLPGVRLVSLQKGDGAEQLRALAGRVPVVELASEHDPAGAFFDTAAIMQDLDLVITVDTSIAHLAGALAVPVWVALPADPDWRWLLKRQDSPWYPTMRLFRRSTFGDWDTVFGRMAERIRNLEETCLIR